MLYKATVTEDTAINYIYELYEKYFTISKNKVTEQEIDMNLEILSKTYQIPITQPLQLLRCEAQALQMFINMQLKLFSLNEKDMKPQDKYAHINSTYIIQAHREEMFERFAKHFVYFNEPDRIKRNIINPAKAKSPHLTHIQYFLLSLYYKRTKSQLVEETINGRYFANSSYGIFPIIWAELKYCMDNNIYINHCSICYEYYTTDRSSMCCYNPECKKKLKAQAPSENKEQKSTRNRKDYTKRKNAIL